MKKNIYLIILTFIFIFGVTNVKASSGALRKDSIITCDGVTYGKHGSDSNLHWHIAEKKGDRYYPNGEAIYSEPCNTNVNTNVEENTNNNQQNSVLNSNNNNQIDTTINKNNIENSNNNATTTLQSANKSSDNTLKSIVIDEKIIEVADNIYYSTKNYNIKISVTLNDEKAKYVINNNSNLKIGKNIITIEVTAEDGNKKVYNVNVTRKKLSSDTGIKVTINEKDVIFNDNKANIRINSDEKTLKIKYKPTNKNAKISIDKLDELKTGKNILKMIVTAEDESQKEYNITIYKCDRKEEILSSILGITILFASCYAIYYTIIKIISNKKNNTKI